MNRQVLQVTEVTAHYGRGTHARQVLSSVSLRVGRGESIALVGASGAGKTTLADIVLGLRQPSAGRVLVNGQNWCAATVRPTRQLRHLVQGVPQDPAASFVPRWSIQQSITQAVRRLSDAPALEPRIRWAAELAQFSPDLLRRRPSELSGGQAQRAALTRALAVRPAVLVADEPTSALDTATAAAVAAGLLQSVAEAGVALLLVTHDPGFAAQCSHTLTITPPPINQKARS